MSSIFSLSTSETTVFPPPGTVQVNGAASQATAMNVFCSLLKTVPTLDSSSTDTHSCNAHARLVLGLGPHSLSKFSGGSTCP